VWADTHTGQTLLSVGNLGEMYGSDLGHTVRCLCIHIPDNQSTGEQTMIEIERKYLVDASTLSTPYIEAKEIKQGYLSIDPERTVRVRIHGNLAFITVKGISSDDGLSRYEWEKDIEVDEAEELLALCVGVIEKTRYLIMYDEEYWEVDEFHGDNEGLILAEIELRDEDQKVSKPPFVGKEVTGDVRYYNSYLINNPYKGWKE
jgi:adenylate cyclase